MTTVVCDIGGVISVVRDMEAELYHVRVPCESPITISSFTSYSGEKSYSFIFKSDLFLFKTLFKNLIKKSFFISIFGMTYNEGPLYINYLGESTFRDEQMLQVEFGSNRKEEIQNMITGETETGTNEKVLRHRAICEELNKIYEAKNHDYGDSFHKTWLEEGPAMARIRLTDKLERFKRLTKLSEVGGDGAAVTDESVVDTLMDLANYALMTVLELKGE